jgi:hypothetical protein
MRMISPRKCCQREKDKGSDILKLLFFCAVGSGSDRIELIEEFLQFCCWPRLWSVWDLQIYVPDGFA